jgi:hypothetical protein
MTTDPLQLPQRAMSLLRMEIIARKAIPPRRRRRVDLRIDHDRAEE